MWEFVKSIFSPTQYMPHGHCYLWQTPLVWLHVISDLLIALAYFSIPALLIYFVYKRRDVPFLGIFGLFGAFIVCCGTGHLLEIWTLWHSAYWLSGIEKAMTAIVSCYTAAQMVTLLPQFLSLKTPQELELINSKLEQEIAERQNAELALRLAYEELEVKVKERTAELRETNTCLEAEIREKITAEAMLREKEIRLREQQASLLKLSKNSNIYEGNTSKAFREITEVATLTLNVERGSIWFYSHDKSVMLCADLYHLSANQHSRGGELKIADYPAYFQAVNAEKAIVAIDAITDPRTREFSESYLIASGITSMLDVPISHQGKVVGVICLEHKKTARNWTLDEQNFASYLAQMTALALASQERKQAESELRLVTERLQHLLSATPAVIFSCKLGGDYDVTFVSENVASMIGYEAQEFIDGSLDWHNLIHPDDREKVKSEFQKILEKEFISYEYRERHKDGHYVWVYDAVKLVKNSAGVPVECVGYAVDITARKEAEFALQQQLKREQLVNAIQERIRSSLNLEEVLNMAVEEVRHFLATDRTVIYRFNPDLSGFIAVESVADLGLSILGIDIHDPCFGERYTKLYEEGRIRAINNIYAGDIAQCHVDLLTRLGIKANLVVPILEGKKLWGLLIAHHCKSARIWESSEMESLRQISVQLAIAIQQCMLFEQATSEISERKLAEEALQKAVVRADAANKAKSEFLASMSHELRTPLNAILGFSQLMGRDASLKVEHQEHLEIINRSGEHLLALINDILDMSKIEAGRSKLNESSFNLRRMIKNLENMLRLKAEAKKLQLVFDVAKDLPEFVTTDEGKLRQVLINLLGNAIKFTERGKVTLQVKMNACKVNVFDSCISPRQTSLLFEIEDTGPGIYPQEISKLFEPFGQTVSGLKSQQGTGLGLPISRKFVQLMGGDIRVVSTLGKGSIFAFEISVKVADSGAIVMTNMQPMVMGLAPNQPPYRILAVDDRLESRLVLVKLLSSVGFEVREAANGKEAIAVWENWQPHLIFMDMQMPVMNGYEATQYIKADIRGKTTAIVALTASAFEEERTEILAAGCDDFLRKPFQQNILFSKIEELLGVRYLYEVTDALKVNKKAALSQVYSQDSLAEELSKMPREWVAQMWKAANECCDDKVFQLIKEMPVELASLAGVIKEAADNFLFEDIIELCSNQL
ncbi:GAF domain-containing protein [Ancylothrix sp. C2]|nr:GAF domain-containing protein [Ancylothrix sp. D3o]